MKNDVLTKDFIHLFPITPFTTLMNNTTIFFAKTSFKLTTLNNGQGSQEGLTSSQAKNTNPNSNNYDKCM